MKAICARFIDFPPPTTVRAYRHDLDETGLSSPSVGLNQHPLWTSAFRTILKTQHKIPCQKSQVAEPKEKAPSRNQFASLDRRVGSHAGTLTEDNRNRKRSRAPCRVGLNQHVLELAPACDVRNGRKDETEPKPARRGQKASAARHPAEGKEFWRRGAAQGIPVGARCRMNPASEFFSSGRRAVDGHRYPAMQPGATARAEERRVIIAFTVAWPAHHEARSRSFASSSINSTTKPMPRRTGRHGRTRRSRRESHARDRAATAAVLPRIGRSANAP